MTEREFRDYIYEKAQKVKTKKELDALLKEIVTPKSEANDYGKICYAMAAAMEAALNYINNSPNGGITGFQASVIGWEMIKKLMHESKVAMRIIDYEEMLYPQYEYKFKKIISDDVWIELQNQAKINLEECPDAHPKVIEHWKSIIAGNVPFGYEVAENKDEGN